MLRHRRGWRQADLAIRAGVSSGVVGLIERGAAERLSLRMARQVASAVGLRLGWDIGPRRAELARLGDADHARCTDELMRRLEALGWLTRAEVSFNEFGERGRIDVLAFHPPTGTLLVIEVKTLIVDAQELLGSLDVKRRVGVRVARSLGLPATNAVPMLAVLKTTTNRRRIDGHPHLFGSFTLRGRRALGWLRDPRPYRGGLLLMLDVPDRNQRDVRRAGRQRVRIGKRAVSVDEAPAEPIRRHDRA